MAKSGDVGLKKLENGYWSYRITVTLNGKKKDTTFHRDGNGNPFVRKADAKRAREQKLLEIRAQSQEGAPADCKLSEIWDCYMEKVAPGKRPATVKKYLSLWKQHVEKAFGNKNISEINVLDMERFLQELYDSGLSWNYVVGFRRLFYQLFGLAYKEEKITSSRYTRMFIDKGTKLKMPEMSQRDYEKNGEIRIYNSYEISQFKSIFEDSSCFTAFLLGYMCGLRLGETFGLLWDDYNWETHQLTVCRQMVYEDGCFCLRNVKTLKGSRVIEVPDLLHKNLMEKIREQKRHPVKGFKTRASETVLDKTRGREPVEIQGGDFINRKKTGELLTTNSIKYYAQMLCTSSGST